LAQELGEHVCAMLKPGYSHGDKPKKHRIETLMEIREKYEHHPHMLAWRIADHELNFQTCDRGEKGFLNTRECRKMLLNFGIPWGKAVPAVPDNRYFDFESAIDRVEAMQTGERLKDAIWRLFVHTDRAESGELKPSGFLDYKTIEKRMTDHGLTEDELYIFLAPYKRADGKVEYAKLHRDLFPDDPLTA